MSSSTTHPLLTCIIATYNAAQNLPLVLHSLHEQDLHEVEIIIQDGASQDDTVKVAQQWQEKLPCLHIFSLPDKGIFDAWNKALSHVQGDWVFFMGADDICLHEKSLSHIKEVLRNTKKDVSYVASPIAMLSEQEDSTLFYPKKDITRAIIQGMALPHQGLFHRKELFSAYTFDTQYRVAGDYDFLVRTFKLGNIAYTDTPYIGMRAGGISSSLDTMWLCSLEQWRISRKYFPKAVPWKLALRHVRNMCYFILSRGVGKTHTRSIAHIIKKLYKRKPYRIEK